MKPNVTPVTARRGVGGLVLIVGFLLSPLSWWNDLVVNVPLALAFAWIVSYFYPPAFGASWIVGYWLTNVVGLIMMHWGTTSLLAKGQKGYSKTRLIRDLLFALGYTGLIVILINLKILGPIPTVVLPK